MAETQGALRQVTLDDKFDLSTDRVFLTGTQAIIRLLLMQRERDRLAGLDTAGFVSGYRGSPIGGLDQNLWRARDFLDRANIVFQPGLNEELAATAVWGSQQAEMRGEGKYDGVFGVWYGKGPGVDRSGDVFRHANMAGSSAHGGVLAFMGDDHTAESSTVAHQSEFHFVDVMIPILNPAGVQDILDYGLYGFAMSRFCGSWVAFKCVKDNIESTASVDGRIDRVKIVIPDDFRMPPGGLNIRARDAILEQEARLHDFKRDAMLAFVAANNLNRVILSGGRNPKIGIITVGKSYLDVRQALDELGLDEVGASDMGLRLYKVACPWPLSKTELVGFARGLDLIIVVEEKRSLIEVQVREELYGTADQPVCIGKKDEDGRWLFPVKGALDVNDIAIAIGAAAVALSRERRPRRARAAPAGGAARPRRDQRRGYAHRRTFCPGCPHNTSTKVPEGARAYAGIGCHYMAQWMDRATEGFTQMGGEGANWIGECAFSTRPHVFQNLGDGTYNHSGSLALRWAVATGTPVTYKILFNDAVAMTGGQPTEGHLTVDKIAAQVRAEGVERIALVTDEPDKYPKAMQWPSGLTTHHRDDLDAVQRELATVPGVSVLIYDQTCAAEKRRRRKRGEFPDPDKRVIINDLVCEGCGDCSVQSNCVAVQPLETEFGRKRQIDQSSCNKDFSCLRGFCPSFVTVHGAKPRRSLSAPLPLAGEVDAAAAATGEGKLPEPPLPAIERTYNIIVTGVGGTGVVTVGAILGMAAHLEGKGCGMIDMAGLAQKGGAVYSHVRLAKSPDDIHAIRVTAGAAASRPRLRPRRHRHQAGARLRQAGAHRARRQHGRDHARRLHPRRRFLAADRAHPARHPGGGRPRRRRLRRRHRGGDGDPRQRHRGQHVHARLRVPEGSRAAGRRVHRGGHPPQRRSRHHEPRRLRVRPPRRRRAGARRRADERARGADALAPSLRDARRGDRPPRRLPDRRTRTAPTPSATGLRSSASGPPRRMRSPTRPRSPTRSRATSSSSWPTRTNTRSRGSTRTASSPSRSRRPSRATTCATSSTWRRRFSPAATRRRACRAR